MQIELNPNFSLQWRQFVCSVIVIDVSWILRNRLEVSCGQYSSAPFSRAITYRGIYFLQLQVFGQARVGVPVNESRFCIFHLLSYVHVRSKKNFVDRLGISLFYMSENFFPLFWWRWSWRWMAWCALSQMFKHETNVVTRMDSIARNLFLPAILTGKSSGDSSVFRLRIVNLPKRFQLKSFF